VFRTQGKHEPANLGIRDTTPIDTPGQSNELHAAKLVSTTTDPFTHPKKYVKSRAAATTQTFTSENPFSIPRNSLTVKPNRIFKLPPPHQETQMSKRERQNFLQLSSHQKQTTSMIEET
jgi:hypothetical protein